MFLLNKQRQDTNRCPALNLYCGGFFLGQTLFRGGEHQLDAVELVDLRRAGVVVHGYDVGLGIGFFSALMTPLPTTWLGRHAKG